jgi:cell division septal protein FtsQ
MLVLTAAAISVALNPGWLKIQSVQLELDTESNEQLLFQRINNSLRPRTEKLEGQYIWKITLPEIYELIAQDKRVKTISLYREFPNVIKAKIRPYTPVMAYLASDNRFYPIAMDATLLPSLPKGEFPDMPILRGEEFKDDPALRASAIELFNTVGTEGALKRSAISEIIYSRKDGFKIFLNSTSGEIKLGDSDFGPKLSRVQKVLSYLESQNVKSRVIDARFSKKVVVRVRNNP